MAGRTRHSEGVLVGYRWYDRRGIAPLFPFGHGLSYTSFPLPRPGEPRAAEEGKGGTARVRVSLQSRAWESAGAPRWWSAASACPGPTQGVVQPPKALKRFRRVEIPSGRSRDLTFVLEDRDFAVWDVDTHRWRVAPGCYRVMLGSSSRDIRLRLGGPPRGGVRAARGGRPERRSVYGCGVGSAGSFAVPSGSRGPRAGSPVAQAPGARPHARIDRNKRGNSGP